MHSLPEVVDGSDRSKKVSLSIHLVYFFFLLFLHLFPSFYLFQLFNYFLHFPHCPPKYNIFLVGLIFKVIQFLKV